MLHLIVVHNRKLIYIHAHIHTYTYMQHAYIHTYTYINIRTYIHTYVCMYVCMYVFMYVCMYMYMYMYGFLRNVNINWSDFLVKFQCSCSAESTFCDCNYLPSYW